MIAMRTILWFCSVLIGVSLVGAQSQMSETCQQSRTDSYSMAFVESAFQFFKASRTRATFSFEVRRFTNNSPSLAQLGDCASIAILKLYRLDELAEPENAEPYLTLIRNSFADRNRVLEESDKAPNVTSLILRYLEQKEETDPVIERRIAYMKMCVRDFASAPQSEADFFNKK
jgi:hypothetical protein